MLLPLRPSGAVDTEHTVPHARLPDQGTWAADVAPGRQLLFRAMGLRGAGRFAGARQRPVGRPLGGGRAGMPAPHRYECTTAAMAC